MRKNKNTWFAYGQETYFFWNCFLIAEMYNTKYIINGVNNIENRKPPQKPNFLLLEITATIKLDTMYIPRN
jgi:hypothetical protein